MIHALHGNFGLPADFAALAESLHLRSWNLWDLLSEPGYDGLTAFGARFRGDPEDRGQRPWLIGYSLGGRLALHSLLAHPEDWAGSILLSTHPGLQTPGEREERLSHDAVWAASCDAAAWPAVLQRWHEQPLLATTVPAAPIPASYAPAVQQGFRCWSLGQQQDLRPALARLALPVLWLTGEGDPKFTHLAAEVCHGHPTFHHQVISRAGHRLLQHAPKAVAIAVNQFIKNNIPREPSWNISS